MPNSQYRVREPGPKPKTTRSKAASADVMTIIEAEPYPFDLDPARNYLLIFVMHRDFVEPGGFGV
jgi:hypothetical protein